MSSAGKWDYSGWQDRVAYGDVATYAIGYDFLQDCEHVEDWGCGGGWFANYCRPGQYYGIDGSASPFADEVAPLEQPREPVDGIFMRHVLEHNLTWRAILDNAVACARRKLCVVIFTPLAEQTHVMSVNANGIPDIAFNLDELTDAFQGLTWQVTGPLRTHTQYGVEHVFMISKDA